MEAGISIGRLARNAAVSVETIRYYQRRGLLTLPEKPASGPRLYTADATRSLRFIKRAQGLGFSLDEIGQLMMLTPANACAATQQVALNKLRSIDEKVATLQAARSALETLLRQCRAGENAPCAIISALRG